MFCHLFVLSDRITQDIHEFEQCSKECKQYRTGDCAITNILNERLTNDKFGWVIEKKTVFAEELGSKTGKTKFLSAITLIHPMDGDIVILLSSRIDKETQKWFPVYKAYQYGKSIELLNIEALNSWLRGRKYDGRKLAENDFPIEVEECTQ